MATKKLELHDTIKTWMEKINDNLTVIDGINMTNISELVLVAAEMETYAENAKNYSIEARNYVDDIYSAQTVIELSNSRIVNLSPPPSASISNPKLLGMTMAFMGTGINNSPTGSFRFVPPNGWTVNGSSSGVEFSNFNKPAFFVIYYNRTGNNILISII